MRKALLCVLVLALGGLAAAYGTPQSRSTPIAIEAELEKLAVGRNSWPGFEPLTIPLAIYDGSKTYLFRHPSPDAGFTRDGSVFVMEGRHPAVTSNTNAEIGGVMTATLMTDGPRGNQPANELAAVALHESFHVFQRVHHQGWSGNEGDLLLYPVDDARLLAWRREETEALRRALVTKSKTDSACWARVAMAARTERFAAMDSAFSRYERLTELNEGLATYVQRYALWQSAEFPAQEFDASAVRQRAYTVGPAMALLLDRFRPDWQESLEHNDRQTIDEMLTAALETAGARPSCAFSAKDLAAIEARAKTDAGAVASKRSERRRQFDAQPGWRIIIETDAKHPLWPNGFDPLNVERVDGGLLHTRFLKLKNDDGEIEALDGEGADITVFTEGPGPHPLFNGVSRAVVVVAEKPEVNIWGEHRVAIETRGVKIKVEHADVHQNAHDVRIRLGN